MQAQFFRILSARALKDLLDLEGKQEYEPSNTAYLPPFYPLFSPFETDTGR